MVKFFCCKYRDNYVVQCEKYTPLGSIVEYSRVLYIAQYTINMYTVKGNECMEEE